MSAQTSAARTPARLPAMSMERRLCEYAQWLQDERLADGLDAGEGSSIFQRIREERHNAGAGAAGNGSRHDILVVDGESFSTRPDGGMARMAERLGQRIARDNRCREIHDLVCYLPVHHREVLRAAYGGPEVRTVRAAAEMLGVSKATYCERKARLVGWFEGAMFRGMGNARC
jgi:hypothetical protein